MFYAIIFEPASPNPIAINAPIFNIVFSKIYISETLVFLLYIFYYFYNLSIMASFSSNFIAAIGFLVIFLIFSIIFDIGIIINLDASLENVILVNINITATVSVLTNPTILF